MRHVQFHFLISPYISGDITRPGSSRIRNLDMMPLFDHGFFLESFSKMNYASGCTTGGPRKAGRSRRARQDGW